MAPTTSPRSPGLGRHVTEVATLTLGSLEIPCTRALFGALSAELDRTPAVAAQPLMGTGKIANTAELSGAVAVMRRGEISFVEKALKAQLRQAVALVVVNSDNHPFVPDAGTLDTSDISIPVVCVRKSDGARLLERLKRSASLRGAKGAAAGRSSLRPKARLSPPSPCGAARANEQQDPLLLYVACVTARHVLTTRARRSPAPFGVCVVW